MQITARLSFRRYVSTFSCLIGLVAFGGCVSTPQYPVNWAPGFPDQGMLLRRGYGCNLTGDYSDAGEVRPEQGNRITPSLFRTLFPDSKLPSTVILDTITIRGPERGVVEVIARKDGVIIETRQLKEQEDLTSSNYAGRYLCLANGLVYANSWGGGGGSPVAVGGSAIENFLYRGMDGSLVLKRNDLTVILPWWLQWKTHWYRFPPVVSGQETQ